MFRINGDQSILMNRGDSTRFPLFINKGSRLHPIRYGFEVGDPHEIYFYILQPNQRFEDAFFIKTFKCVEGNINENGDMIISLDSNDTINFPEGRYLYLIRAKLYNDATGKFDIVTVTNKHEFYLIDDNYTQRSWR